MEDTNRCVRKRQTYSLDEEKCRPLLYRPCIAAIFPHAFMDCHGCVTVSLTIERGTLGRSTERSTGIVVITNHDVASSRYKITI